MAKIIIDGKPICDICNEAWQTDGDGEPLCCDDAVQEWLDAGEPRGGK